MQAVDNFYRLTGGYPGLAVVLVGTDPASALYVENKKKAAKRINIWSYEFLFPATVSQVDLLQCIEGLNKDPAIHGILIQLPLPKHMDPDVIIQAVDPLKDVDGFHGENIGKLWQGGALHRLPCTPLGCMYLLKMLKEEISGKKVVVVGRSNIVGKPLIALLLRANATVSVAHSHTRNLEALTSQADILFACIGSPEYFKASWIQEGSVIIDVGINVVKKGIVGDVDFQDVLWKVKAITPVPGGVGPLTIAGLLRNTVISAYQLEDKNPPADLLDII